MKDTLLYTKNIINKGDIEKVRIIVFNALYAFDEELSYKEKFMCRFKGIDENSYKYKKVTEKTNKELEEINKTIPEGRSSITYVYHYDKLVGFSKMKKIDTNAEVYICYLDEEYNNFYDIFVKTMTKELPRSNNLKSIDFVLPNCQNEKLIKALCNNSYYPEPRQNDKDTLIMHHDVTKNDLNSIDNNYVEVDKNELIRKRRNITNK